MDPNACWNDIVTSIIELQRSNEGAAKRDEKRRDIADALLILADWIRRGGFPPALNGTNANWIAPPVRNAVVWGVVETAPEPELCPCMWCGCPDDANALAPDVCSIHGGKKPEPARELTVWIFPDDWIAANKLR